jgi:hypothetical protein
MSELKFQWKPFEDALTLRMATSAKLAEEVLKEQARGIFRNVIAITPPGHVVTERVQAAAGLGWMRTMQQSRLVGAGSREGTAAGKAKVASDISKLYGTPSSAYDAIEKKSPADARAFWAVRRTRPDAAADIVMKHTGTWFGPFDGGKLHKQRFQRGSVNGRRGRPILYISNPKELSDYIKSKQARVSFLAAGWRDISEQLGITLPESIGKHKSAPSSAQIVASMERIVIRATNGLSYATDAGLRSRIQDSINRQAGAMERQWKEFMEKQFSKII